MNKTNQVNQMNQRNQTHHTRRGQLFGTLLKWLLTDGTVLPGFQISEKLFINIKGLNDTRRRVVRGVSLYKAVGLADAGWAETETFSVS